MTEFLLYGLAQLTEQICLPFSSFVSALSLSRAWNSAHWLGEGEFDREKGRREGNGLEVGSLE